MVAAHPKRHRHASSTFLSALLPQWVHDGGISKFLERIANPTTRERIITEHSRPPDRWQTAQGTIGWDEIMIATCPSASEEGSSLAELAEQRRRPVAQAMLDLLIEHDAAVSVVMFSQSESNVRKALTQPYVMIGSDSLGSCGDGPHKGRPHPRMYGTFPRVLGRYVREGLFSHEQAVAKMTGQPAAKLGLRNRGLVREGYFADLALFDPESVRDEATFEQPHSYPSGIPYVTVNGKLIVDGGQFNARPAGRILGRGSASHS